jgi:hypothetical protein
MLRKLQRRALEFVADKSNGKRFDRAPMQILDKWGHKLRFPKFIQHDICNAFDHWVGVDDDSDIPDDIDCAEQDCGD